MLPRRRVAPFVPLRTRSSRWISIAYEGLTRTCHEVGLPTAVPDYSEFALLFSRPISIWLSVATFRPSFKDGLCKALRVSLRNWGSKT
jgi:hypothetical protein